MGKNTKYYHILLTHFDGHIFEGDRNEFLQKYKMNKNSLYALLSGRRRNINGWYLSTNNSDKSGESNMSVKSKHHYIVLYHFDGHIFEGDRNEFLQKYKMNKNSLYAILCGQRRHICGWYLPTTDMSEDRSGAFKSHYHRHAKTRMLKVFWKDEYPELYEDDKWLQQQKDKIKGA